jgi:hypothetical protein
MNTTAPAGLSLPELVQRLRTVEPAALLVRPRLLRRVIKRDRAIPGLGLGVPHAHCHVLPRARLLEIATPWELGIPSATDLGEVVLLLPQPSLLDLRAANAAQTLIRYSRLLLHATLHRTFQERLASGALTSERIQERIAELGETAWAEIRAVLTQERLLLPPETPETVYEEFASVFLELAYHAPHTLPRWFPAIDNHASVKERLESDLGATDLGDRTLLAGSPSRGSVEVDAPREAEVLARPLAAGYSRERLLVQAKAGAIKGNLVRSAILRVRAGEMDQARATVGELAQRLKLALKLGPEETQRWENQFVALLEPAAAGSWSRAARLLYDVQTVCQDREKPIFAVDLVEWVLRFGGPLQRELPFQGEVLSCKHLRRALDRVAGLPIPEENRAALSELLTTALNRAEEEVRTAFRPRLVKVLDAVGFNPTNHVETLDQGKVVSELLEGIVTRGYLNLGDLRDIIARNRLKLGDLTGPGEFLVGDPLIRANRELALQLDGVYHRGEFYLRWLQSFSSLTFGTRLGRFLTLWLILPVLGAFLLLMFAEEIRGFLPRSHSASEEEKIALVQDESPDEEPRPAEVKKAERHLPRLESVLVVALLLLPIIHSASVRGLLLQLLWRLGQGLDFLFVRIPRAVLLWPPILRVLQSRLYLACFQLIIKPAAFAVVVTWLAWLFGAPGSWLLGIFLGVFAVALVANLTPLAQHLEELAGDGLVRTWTLVRDDLLIGAFEAIIALFRRITEEVDRLFYTVDEWLRYREGEGRGSLVLKAILGSFWWAITYVFRFAFTVLIEPQINPIKHFPVVTVGHKILLLAALPSARFLSASLGTEVEAILPIVILVFSLIPGFFGFLAWELKENWRLYRASQSPTLDPVRVGSHGETMRGLLRPGFHSGTIPKLFARLRHLPERTESPRLHRTRDALHHSARAIVQFVQRDLIDVLVGTKLWRDRVVLRVGHPRLDTRRLRIPLLAEGMGENTPPLLLAFEQTGPWLVFRVEDPGWLHRLPEVLWTLWRDALLGFCKHAGVQLTPTQLAAAFPAGTRWTLDEDGLKVTGDTAPPARYDLEAEKLEPRDEQGLDFTRWPVLTPEAVRFDAHPVRWGDWVEVWQQAQKGHKPPVLLPGVPLPGCP